MPRKDLSFTFSRGRALAILALFGISNIIMLIGTWAFTVYYRNLAVPWDEASNLKYLLVQFNLGVENVVASWYSSMLLFVIGVGCFLCWLADRKDRSTRWFNLTLGWLCLAFLFVGLSLDELGSIHERIPELSVFQQNGENHGWEYLLAIPILAVGIAMLAFTFVHLAKERKVLALMILGIALFLSIPLQEKFEQDSWSEVGRDEQWQRPLRYVFLEEGSELFGMLAFLAATAVYLRRRTEGDLLPISITSVGVAAISGSLLAICAIGFPVVNYLGQHTAHHSHGIPENWFPGFLGVINAILCWQMATQPNQTHRKHVWWIFAAILLCISAYFGANLHNYRFTLGDTAVWQLLHWLAAIPVLWLGANLAFGMRSQIVKTVPLLGAILIAWSLLWAHTWIEPIGALGLIGLFAGLLLSARPATVVQPVRAPVQKMNMASP